MPLKPHLRGFIVLFAVLSCVPTSPRAQTGSATKPGVPAPASAPPATGGTAAPESPVHPLTAKEQREAQIAADTEKLYQLAQELKVELDKSNKDTLSLTVIRKAAEIEKLAHSISERMKSN